MLAVFTLAQILGYPFPAALVRDDRGTAIAYAVDTRGVRTLWFARAPRFGRPVSSIRRLPTTARS